MKQAQNILTEFSTNMQIKEEFYNLNIDLNGKMNGLKAPDITCTGLKNDEIKLSNLPKGKPVLIFKYSELNCNTCYEEGIKELQNTFGDDLDKVVILCSYRSKKDFIVFRKINRIKFDIYSISSDAFNWPVENLNIPYYFVLYPDMKISNIYAPNRSYPEINKQYLEGIKRFLSN